MTNSSEIILHDIELSIFVVTHDGQQSYLRYVETKNTFDILSTQVASAHRGRGVAAELNESAIKYAESKNLQVIATCSYTATYVQRRKNSKS